MPTYTPSRNYPHVGGDRLVADQLNRDLEFNPGPLPPANPNSASGAGQFKFWVDTSTPLPALRQCVATRATAGVYVPTEWLTIGNIDISNRKFILDTTVVISGPVNTTTLTTDTLTVTGLTTLSSLTLTGDLTGINETLTGTLTVPTLTATNATVASTLTAGNIVTPGTISAAALTISNVVATAAIDTGQYMLDGHVVIDGDALTLTIYDTTSDARLVLGATNHFHQTEHHIFQDSTGITEYAMFDLSGTYNASGSWIMISDDSLKENVAPYQAGLVAIRQLNPVSYNYKAPVAFAASKDGAPVTRYGLMASEVQPVLPEMVSSVDVGDTPAATLSPSHLLYVLLNAVKELDTRVIALETP